MTSTPKVSVGWSSIIGWLIGAVGVVTAGLTAVSGSEAQLHGPGKWAAILGVASIVATNAGRQLQAAGVKLPVPAVVTETLGALPTLEQELAAQPPPQSSVVPDGAVPAAPPAPAAA
jgi:hypothetical protein